MKAIPYRGHLIIPADNRVAVMIPHAKPFESDGQQMMLVPHGVDETTILRNLDYDVRPPIMLQYDWPSPPDKPPFDAQKQTTALITSNRRSYVLNGLGTGKTRAALYAYDYLRKASLGKVGKALITAPLSTLRQTWAKELLMVFPEMKYEVLHGSKAKRVKLLDSDADIFIINHDGVEVIIEELMERKHLFGYAVLDELSVYKNARTELFKKTYRFISEVDRVTGLTATPMPQAATDAYGQLKMLTPAVLKGMPFGRFREMTMKKVSQFRWINQRDAVERVHAMMQPSVRFTRDDCYDIPPCQTMTVEAQLTPQQHKWFVEMQNESAIVDHNVVAVNAADMINKLLQIALGVVYDRDHNVLTLGCPSRLQELDNVIEQSDSKVIVLTPYTHTLNMLVEHVRKRWTAEFISGDVNPTQRERIFTAFMHSPDPHVLVAHPATMSHGLTLTEASTIIWFGPPNSLETYEQANGRITRAGQRHSQLIVHLIATKLEAEVFKLLERRANVQQALLDMFERQDKGDLS